MVSAARRPRRPRDAARQGDRQDRRSGGAAGDRQAHVHVEGQRMDRAPCPGRAEHGPSAGPRRLAWETRVEQRRPTGRARAHLSHRLRRPAHGQGQSDGGRDRRDLRLVPATSIAGGTDEIQRNIISDACSRCPRSPASTPTSPSRTCRATLVVVIRKRYFAKDKNTVRVPNLRDALRAPQDEVRRKAKSSLLLLRMRSFGKQNPRLRAPGGRVSKGGHPHAVDNACAGDKSAILLAFMLSSLACPVPDRRDAGC